MRRIEDSRASIDAMAAKVSRRLRAAGVTAADIEDVRSELSIAWCIARDTYDPERGASFSTYLWRGMLNHISHWARREVGIGLGQLSTDEVIEASTTRTRGDMIAAPHAGPHEILVERQLRALAETELSLETQRFLDLLESPPPEVVEVLEAAQDRASFARSRGLKAVAPTGVTASMVFDVMGAGRTERARAYAEIRRLSEKVNQK